MDAVQTDGCAGARGHGCASRRARVQTPAAKHRHGHGSGLGPTALLLAAIGASAAAAQELPPPRAESSPAAVRFEDFVGAEACRGCHEEQWGMWQGSAHGRAGGPPGPERLIVDFDGSPIRFRDALVTPSVTDGRYGFIVQRVGRPAVAFQVDGVVGGAHMVGGGTQGFVSRYPDGTVRFLPFDFVRREGVWFCNTANILGWWTTETDRAEAARLNEGWVPITPDMRLADCGDWPPIRTLGTTTDFQSCQDCHGSQILLQFDTTALRYETRYTSLAINCESCHGPARRHVELMEAGPPENDIGLESLAVLDKDESLEVCFRCHAVKQPLEPGFLPGMDLERFYSLKTPLWLDEPLRPDGRIRTFAYQMNHLYSECYLNGPMTCVDCHAPHGLGYRDIRGRPLSGRFDDGQCVDCHPSKADAGSAHTHHLPDSEGSSCVACHMPYRQHPTVGDAIRFSRADHTIPLPRPASEEELGTASACALCHREVPADQLQERVDTWYGELKPYHPLVKGMMDAADVQDEAQARRLLLRPDLHHPAAQGHALGLYVRRFLRPGMEPLHADAKGLLRQLADDPDLDVKALALAGLHLADGDPATRAFLSERLEELADRDGPLRERWIQVLRTVGDASLARGDPEGANTVYGRALELIPDHVGVLSDLALTYSSMGRFEDAVAYFDRSLEADPYQSQVLVNRGVALENLGRAEEAISSYELAVRRNPGEALAYFNLGNVRFVRGDYDAAAAYYRASIQHNPRLVNGHLMLAQTWILVNQPDSAVVSARNVLEFDPTNEAAQRMLMDLIR